MSSSKQGILISTLVHLLMLFFMFAVNVRYQQPLVREYIEIIAFEFVEPLVEIPVTRQPAGVLPRQPVPAQQPTTQIRQDPILAQQIDIPEVTIPDFEPIDISQLPERADRNVRTNIHRAAVQDTLMMTTIPSPTISDITQATNPGQTTPGHGVNLEGFADEIRTQAGNLARFSMEGDVINRLIIENPLPAFPTEVQRNGAVTMEFVVVPNGSVQNIVITRRSEPEFDRLSLQYLRQWTFNRADRSHTGRITFNFTRE
jgi:TonB family protein